MQAQHPARPLGVTIIAAILGIGAILSIILLVLGLFGVGNFGDVSRTVLTIALSIGLLFALLDLLLAWGLWTLRPWAFWATAIIEGLSVLNGLYQVLFQHANFLSVLLSLLFPIVVLLYLFADRNVRPAFNISA